MSQLNEARTLLNARLLAIRAHDKQLRRVPMAAVLAIPTTKSGVWTTHSGELRLAHQGRVIAADESCFFRLLRKGRASLLFGEEPCVTWDAGPRTERFPTEALAAELRNEVSQVTLTIRGHGRQRWQVWCDVATAALFSVNFYALPQCFEVHVKRGHVLFATTRREQARRLVKGQCLVVDVTSGATRLTELSARERDFEQGGRCAAEA